MANLYTVRQVLLMMFKLDGLVEIAIDKSFIQRNDGLFVLTFQNGLLFYCLYIYVCTNYK